MHYPVFVLISFFFLDRKLDSSIMSVGLSRFRQCSRGMQMNVVPHSFLRGNGVPPLLEDLRGNSGCCEIGHRLSQNNKA